MTETIRLFIIDDDLRVRKEGTFEVGDGGKIRIKSGGTENWNPLIGNTTFIEKKGWKKWLLFGERNWRREYYVKHKGAQCIDFHTEYVPTPDPEELKKANMAMMAKDIGKDSNKETPWWAIVLILFSLLSMLMLLGISGVFR